MIKIMHKIMAAAFIACSFPAQAEDLDFDVPFLTTDEPESHESSDARQTTRYHVGIELFSVGTNLSIAYQLNRDLALELYTESPPQSTSVTVGPHPCELINGPYTDDGYIRGGRARWFLTNDFNVSVSPYYRKYHVTCTAADGASKLAPVDKASYGLSATVGSRWQWRHYYVGAEWLGLGLERGNPTWRSGTLKSDPYARLIYLRLVLGVSL